jgi:hypothetical protein
MNASSSGNLVAVLVGLLALGACGESHEAQSDDSDLDPAVVLPSDAGVRRDAQTGAAPAPAAVDGGGSLDAAAEAPKPEKPRGDGGMMAPGKPAADGGKPDPMRDAEARPPKGDGGLDMPGHHDADGGKPKPAPMDMPPRVMPDAGTAGSDASGD